MDYTEYELHNISKWDLNLDVFIVASQHRKNLRRSELETVIPVGADLMEEGEKATIE